MTDQMSITEKLERLKPTKSKQQVFNSLSERFSNFASRIQNNPAVRAQLRSLQNDHCFGCDLKLSEVAGHIHHISYERVCKTDTSYKDIPPCGDCTESNKCISKLCLLCSHCHDSVHHNGVAEQASSATELSEPSLKELRSTLYPNLMNRWTPQEDARLVSLWGEGHSLSKIGIALGRSARSLSLRLINKGVVQNQKEAKKRSKKASSSLIQPGSDTLHVLGCHLLLSQVRFVNSGLCWHMESNT